MERALEPFEGKHLPQHGDVLLRQTNDDGDIAIVNGVVEMTGGFETSVYLSLFGGNVDDDGRRDNPNGWWGNLLETDSKFRYVSRTQNLLGSLPLNSANVIRIKRAAEADLEWFTREDVASSVEVAVSLPGLNRVNISGSIFAEGEEFRFSFTENWKAAA